MNIYEYVVITKEGYNISEIEKELTEAKGSVTIPEREVDISNAREGNERSTMFILSESEVEALRADERIYSVNRNMPHNLKKTEYPFKRSKGLYTQFEPDLKDKTDQRNFGLLYHAPRGVGQQRLAQKFESPKPQTHAPVPFGWGDGTYQASDGSLLNADDLPFRGSTAYVHELTGEGVDVIILDGGIEADHPEWLGTDGVSRLQQIDWYAETGITGVMPNDFYTDYNSEWAGHGTHCASIAAGIKHGWAKKANIYFFNILKMDLYQIFDLIAAWHNQKNGERPTIISMSFSVVGLSTGFPNEITYRGNQITTPFGDAANTVFNYDRASLFAGSLDHDGRTGFLNAAGKYNKTDGHVSYGIPLHQSTFAYNWFNPVDGFLSDMKFITEQYNKVLPDGTSQYQALNDELDVLISLGIHAVKAAGNDSRSFAVEHADHYNGDDLWEGDPTANWNNKIKYYYKDNVWTNDLTDYDTTEEFYYQRPNPPYSPNAILVGALDNDMPDDNIMCSSYTNYGAAIDIWAAGTKIAAAAPDPNALTYTFDYEHDTETYPEAEGFSSAVANGTSMAAPQVAGILAMYLEQDPTLTPEQAKKLIISDGKKAHEHRLKYEFTKLDENGSRLTMNFQEEKDYILNYINTKRDYTQPLVFDQDYANITNYSLNIKDERHIHPLADFFEFYDNTHDNFRRYRPSTQATVVAPKSGQSSLDIYEYGGSLGNERTVLSSSSLFDNAVITIDDIHTDRSYITLQLKNADGTNNPTAGLPVKFEATTGTILQAGVHHYPNGNGIDETIVDNGDGSYRIYFEPLADGTLTTITARIGQHQFATSFTYGKGVAVVNFTSTNQAPDLSEAAADGTLVYTATSDWGTIYELGNAGDSSMFSITSVNGEGLVTINQSPDFATKSQYTFEVLARSSAGSTPTSIMVTLDIYDATAPDLTFNLATSGVSANAWVTSSSIGADSASVTIQETASPAAKIGYFSATDASSFSMQTIGDVPSELLVLSNGNVYINTIGLDFETNPQIQVTMRASDVRGNFADYTLTIDVEYVDTAPPVFSLGETTSVSVQEGDNSVGQTIYNCEVNEDATFTLHLDSNSSYGNIYSLVPDPNDASKCSVELNSAMNTDIATSDSFTIRATDADGNFADQLVTVNVLVSYPTITSPTSFTMAENTGSGQVVYTLTGENIDYWELYNSYGSKTAHPMWDFHQQNGTLTFLADVDFDVEDEYGFYFRGHGISSAAGYVTQQVTLTVTDAEAPTNVEAVALHTHSERTYSHDPVNRTLDINITTGHNTQNAVLARLGFSDNTDVNFSHDYTGNLFELNETVFNNRSEIRITALNPNNAIGSNNLELFQTAGTTSFTLTVDDGLGNSIDYTINFNVTVLDLTSPVISPASSTIINTFNENAVQTNSTLQTFTADEPVTWLIKNSGSGGAWSNSLSFTNQNNNLTLYLDANTGVLTAVGVADYEAQARITIKVKATDTSGNETINNYYIDINDVLDTPPNVVCDDNFAFINTYIVGEDYGTINSIGTGYYTTDTTNCSWAIDNDYGQTGENGDPLFAISTAVTGDESRCFIKFNDVPDFESGATKQLRLSCTDNRISSNNVTYVNVIVSLTNVDDEAPVFTVAQPHLTYNVPLAAGSTLVDVGALVSDPDGSISNPLTFSITSWTPTGGFYNIDPATGVITNGYSLTQVGAGYPITARVTDQAGNYGEFTFTVEGIQTLPNLTTDFTPINAVGHASQSSAYNVVDLPFDNGSTGNYHLYIAHKITTNTRWQNDVCIGGIQILDANGNVQTNLYAGSTSYWQTANLTNSSIGTPSSISNASFAAVPTTGTSNKYNVRSTTGSTGTGANGGIHGMNHMGAFPVGTGVLNQLSGAKFLFREASGTSTNGWNYCRTTNSYNMPAQGTIRVAYHAKCGTGYDPMQSIVFGMQ